MRGVSVGSQLSPLLRGDVPSVYLGRRLSEESHDRNFVNHLTWGGSSARAARRSTCAAEAVAGVWRCR